MSKSATIPLALSLLSCLAACAGEPEKPRTWETSTSEQRAAIVQSEAETMARSLRTSRGASSTELAIVSGKVLNVAPDGSSASLLFKLGGTNNELETGSSEDGSQTIYAYACLRYNQSSMGNHNIPLEIRLEDSEGDTNAELTINKENCEAHSSV